MSETPDANTLTSHEQDGRVLSGVGVSAERLADTMERHAPPEPAAPADAAPPVADPAAAQEPPVTRGRQRFSDLTRERDEARAEAAAAKAEREAVARERDEARQRLDTREPAQPPAAAAPIERQPTRPEPSEDEIGAKYPTYAAFSRDLATWVLEQHEAARADTFEARVRDAIANERQRDQFQSSLEASHDRARKVYADFDTLLKGPVGQVPLGPTREEALSRVAFIVRHPQSEHIQYAILKDAALAEKLRTSDALQFGVTVAGLVPASKPAAPAWTPPPAPYATVGGSVAVTTKPSAELAKGFDFDKSGYREKRAAERGVKAKRF